MYGTHSVTKTDEFSEGFQSDSVFYILYTDWSWSSNIRVTHISLSQIWTPCSNSELCLPEWEWRWRTKYFPFSLLSFPNLTVLQQVMDPSNWWLNSHLFSFLYWEPFNYYFANFFYKGGMYRVHCTPLIHNLFFGNPRQERKKRQERFLKITFAILVMFSSDLFSSEHSLIKGTLRAFEHTNHRGSRTHRPRGNTTH